MATFIGTNSPDDTVLGNASDRILGAPGADTNSGAGGSVDNDTLSGSGGSDTIFGGGGNDSILGGDGVDTLYGGDGNDYLSAGSGSNNVNEKELLDGGAGNDYLVAGTFTRIFAGGEGSDTVDLSGINNDPLALVWTNIGGDTFVAQVDQGRSITVSGAEYYIFGDDTLTQLPCFVAGTRVATARGEVAVEDLRVGDLVVTAHGGAPLQPVVWIGHSRVNVTRQHNRAATAPILIKAGALADGAPHRDLRVSPEHAMFLDGHLVPAKHLVNGTSIVQELWCPEVTYWHVELPAHGLLVAEGAVSESYFDDGNRKHFDNHAITTLFKDFASERGNRRYAEAACYPLLTEGPALERLRARLAARAGAMEQRRTA
jgi:hypothetical protein